MVGSGQLFDVFEIFGRGIVVLLDEFEGQAKIGDRLLVGGKAFGITGVEMPAFRSVEAYELNQRLRRVGFLVSGCTKQDLEAFKGHRLQIESASI